MVPAFLYSLYLTLYKTDISLRLTLTAGPKGVRLRGSWLVFLMLRNNADVRRCSYFDLVLPLEKPWPYRFFSFFRPWFSFRATVYLTLRITKEKNTPKSRQLSKPTEKPGRSRLLEPGQTFFIVDATIWSMIIIKGSHDIRPQNLLYRSEVTWLASVFVFCHDIFSLVQTWYVVLHLLAQDNSYNLRRGGRYQLKYWGKFLSTF